MITKIMQNDITLVFLQGLNGKENNLDGIHFFLDKGLPFFYTTNEPFVSIKPH